MSNRLYIAGLWTLEIGTALLVDVILFDDDCVLAISNDGIELWPNEATFLAADPDGDFADMLGFIDHEIERPSIDNPVTETVTTRFGPTTFVPLHVGYIREFVANVILLSDGYRLILREDAIELWPPTPSSWPVGRIGL